MKMIAMIGVFSVVATTAVVGVLSLVTATTPPEDPCSPSASRSVDTAPEPSVTVPVPVELPVDVRALRAGGGAFAPAYVPAAPAAAAVPAVPAAPASPAAPGAAQCAGTGTGSSGGGGVGASFDAGNIISDQVFYNTTAMTEQGVRDFINEQNTSCSAGNVWCLKNLKLTTASQPADAYCKAYTGGPGQDAAKMLYDFSAACGINPQVMLVTLQKEMQGLTKTGVTESSYAAAWGWHCPDSGPGGAVNCDPQYSGFFNQGYGMAKQWSRYRTLIPQGKYNFQVGKYQMLWNVAESGCGGGEVDIKNVATASLYVYTPYQPNPASLAAYPGEGDACSSYGNRNFFRMFQKYFGDTGGGTAPPGAGSGGTGAGPGTGTVLVNGVDVTIPANPNVAPAMVGKVIQAPNADMARALAAGFTTLGMPYVWGGGGSGAPANNGCSRGGGDNNSCGSEIGYDCSGLTAYVLGQAGRMRIPGSSGEQRSGGTTIPFSQAIAGDIIGYPSHVAIFLAFVDGQAYQLEASWVGTPIRISKVSRSDVDSSVHRYW